MNPEQWLSLKWNGGSTMSDRWLNQSKIIQYDSLFSFAVPFELIPSHPVIYPYIFHVFNILYLFHIFNT